MNFVPLLLLLPPISLILSQPLQQKNNTIQLCCQPGEYFAMSRYKCEPIRKYVKINWNLKINQFNTTKTKNVLNIFKDFSYKVHLPCENPEALHWQMNETIDIDVAINTEYCFTPFPLKNAKNYRLVQLDCRWELHYFFAFKHVYIYFFSEFLLIPTLIVFIILKPLHKNLKGKCFICYLISVITTNSFYFIIPHMLLIKYRFPNLVYILMGFTHFFFNMAIIYWINILGFDAWNNFSASYEELNSYEKKIRFCFYSLYAWGMAALTTVPTVWRNFAFIYKNCYKYEQSKSCIMTTYLTLYLDIYFAPVVVIILVINFLIFCCVSWKIYKTRGKLVTAMGSEHFVRGNTTICLRLYVLMGPHWIIIYLLKNYKYIEILITSMNYVESSLIFILFVLKKSVLKLLFKK